MTITVTLSSNLSLIGTSWSLYFYFTGSHVIPISWTLERILFREQVQSFYSEASQVSVHSPLERKQITQTEISSAIYLPFTLTKKKTSDLRCTYTLKSIREKTNGSSLLLRMKTTVKTSLIRLGHDDRIFLVKTLLCIICLATERTEFTIIYFSSLAVISRLSATLPCNFFKGG